MGRRIASVCALLLIQIRLKLHLRVVKARVVPHLQKVLWTICQNVFKIATGRRQVCGNKGKRGERFRLLEGNWFKGWISGSPSKTSWVTTSTGVKSVAATTGCATATSTTSSFASGSIVLGRRVGASYWLRTHRRVSLVLHLGNHMHLTHLGGARVGVGIGWRSWGHAGRVWVGALLTSATTCVALKVTARAILGLKTGCLCRIRLLLIVWLVASSASIALVAKTTSLRRASIAHVTVDGLGRATAHMIHLRHRSHLDGNECQ